jgi:predicted TIM-barrel fold metal-dependent hydrolase
VVPVSQVVFGTDYPYRTSLDYIKALRAAAVFSTSELRAIEIETPMRLFPARI